MMAAEPHPSLPHRFPLFLFGVALVLIGAIANGVQFAVLHILVVPWYMPILATLGVILMAWSTWERRGVLRIVGLVVFTLFMGMQWFVIGVMSRTPEYTGPAQVDKRIPAFAANFADGKRFTHEDLAKGGDSLMLFYRGRW